ncbi:hypothetical protein QQ045_032784 [Rhodiola kirilowii]
MIIIRPEDRASTQVQHSSNFCHTPSWDVGFSVSNCFEDWLIAVKEVESGQPQADTNFMVLITGKVADRSQLCCPCY